MNYESTENGLKMLYPTNWTVEEGKKVPSFISSGRGIKDVVVFSPPGAKTQDVYSARVQVSIDKTFSKSDLQTILNTLIGDYGKDKAIKNFKVLEAKINATLAGNQAYFLTNTQEENGFPEKALEIGAKIGTILYFITYFADADLFDKHLPAAQKMIESFQIAPK